MSQKDYWNSRASSWDAYGVPLIPSDTELDFQESLLRLGGETLVLGVTPQLCKLALKVSNKVTSVDFAEDLIKTLQIEGVEYICQDWIEFLENNNTKYDNILTDGGLLCLKFPESWTRISELIYSRLKPGGSFSPRVYLSNSNKPAEHYDNPNLERFIPSVASVDENWTVRINSNQSYTPYEVFYAFPPREVVLDIFNKFTLEAELVPDYEEGERFVTFVFRRY